MSTTSTSSPRTEATSPRARFRGDIEGLRAIAVGTVLAYHVGVSPVSGGFAGVDIFFVISGFLITGLLLREATTTGRVSIWDFYARRARRLLPAATLVLVVTALAGWALLPGARHHDLAVDVASAAAYVVNWALASRAVDYLAEDSGLSPLQHYWSLSVEEQYYVVWPLLIIGGIMLARRLGVSAKKLLFCLIGAVAVASLLHSAVQTASHPATAYFVTTTRVWELAIGSLLAFAVVRLRLSLSVRAANLLALAGLAAIAWAILAFDSTTPWPGTAALVPTLGAAAIIAAGCRTQDTLVGRVLGTRPMTWLGGISYAVYLWHWPLLVLAEERWPGLSLWQRLGLGALAIVLAWLTKRFVEDPVRFHPRLAARAGVALLAGGAMMASSFAAAALVWWSVPDLDLNARVTGATALIEDPAATEWRVRSDPEAVYTHRGEVTPAPGVAPEDIPTYYADGCQVDQGTAELARGCVYAARRSATTLAMLGDSKMGQWFPTIEDISVRERWRLALYLKSACTFSLAGVEDDCAHYTRNVLDRFRERGAPDLAIVSQGSPDDPELVRGMTEAMRELEQLGTRVVVLADNPTPVGGPVYECVEAADDYADCAYERGANARGVGTPPLWAVADDLDLDRIDLGRWICPPSGERCPAVVADTLVYRQGSHLTASYVRSLAPMLHRELSRLGIAKVPVGRIGVGQVARTRD